jgi:hypothetical protein
MVSDEAKELTVDCYETGISITALLAEGQGHYKTNESRID